MKFLNNFFSSLFSFKQNSVIVALPTLLTSLLLVPEVSHCVNESFSVLLGGRRFDAVPEVHDVARIARLGNDFQRPLLDRFGGSVQEARIEVALNAGSAGHACGFASSVKSANASRLDRKKMD